MPYVETDAWPLLCFFAAIVCLGVALLVIMSYLAPGSRRRMLATLGATVVVIVGFVVTISGMRAGAAAYATADAAKHRQYVQQVRSWLRAEEGVTADTTTVEGLLSLQPEPVVVHGSPTLVRLVFRADTGQMDLVNVDNG
ncbi:hypothetical protein [Galbitalea soli]|uniref:Uncharacterized protein n=1 Tax=Galbitalea soli TaxID=1268042 RepID=A0A7C9PNZ7_9MICO|nr:hypothetical protein [Galbitalea soli]NEM92013.1 hypothetical protein [Galbitalea soli]NYJ32035.1 hypothetical protein [Galbitalea soli]